MALAQIDDSEVSVRVSIIDPGGFNSNIGKNIYNRLKAKGLSFENSLYKDEWENNWVLGGGDLSSIEGPEEIVKKTQHALFDENPKQRYMVVGDPGRAENTMRALLHRMLELNYDHQFSYDREGLIELLDDEFKKINNN